MAIGDVIWTIPVVEHLKRICKYEVTIMTSRPQPYENNPFIDNIVDYNYSISDEKVIDLDNSYESQRDKHILSSYYNTANIRDPIIFKPTLYPNHINYEKIINNIIRLRNRRKLIAMHCSATSIYRIWPKERWRGLINYLNSLDFGIILVGDNNDYYFDDSDNIINLVGKTNLLDVAAILSMCDIFIGGDSGLSHVAFSMGTPSVVLYNLVPPEYRMPYSSLCYPIIPINNSCKFCMKNNNDVYKCNNHFNNECMLNINLSDVIRTSFNLLNNVPDYEFARKLKLFDK